MYVTKAAMLQTGAASCNRTDKVASIEGKVASIEGHGKQELILRDASRCGLSDLDQRLVCVAKAILTMHKVSIHGLCKPIQSC